jgi:hypothetical protein
MSRLLIKLFGRKSPACTPQQALEIQYEILAEHMADPLNNNSLFYEWADGPGKDYPHHMEMVREIEGAPLKPVMMWNDGWERAFREWTSRGRRCHNCE